MSSLQSSNEEDKDASVIGVPCELNIQDSSELEKEENVFPFVPLAVELVEEGASDNNAVENQNTSNEIGDVTEVAENFVKYTDNSKDNDCISENIVGSSTMNEVDSSITYTPTMSFKDDISNMSFKEMQRAYFEDFMFSSDISSSDIPSSSSVVKKVPLSSFPKIVNAVKIADYESLQKLYELLYQRSAWDTEEILIQRILNFSGFNFDSSSEEYFNREVMLKTLPSENLMKIYTILNLTSSKIFSMEFEDKRHEIITVILQFLYKPTKKTRNRQSAAAKENIQHSKIGSSKKVGKNINRKSRPGPKSKTKAKIEQTPLTKEEEILKLETELKNKIALGEDIPQLKVSLIKLELGNFCNLISGGLSNKDKNDGNQLSEDHLKLEFQKVGIKLLEDTFTSLSSKKNEERIGILDSEEKVNQIVTDKKESKTNIKEKESKTNIEEKESKTNIEEKESKTNIEEKESKITIEEKGSKVNVKEKESKVNIKEKERKNNIGKKASKRTIEEKEEEIKKTHEEEKSVQDTKVKLKDLPLVLKSIQNTAEELLLDIHSLLFLKDAEMHELRKNILEFDGFSFDPDSEEYDERKDFLERMSYKIVSEVAKSFSVQISNNKEEVIKAILAFLMKMDEKLLCSDTLSVPNLSDVELDIEGMSDSDDSITCEVIEKKVECIDLVSSDEENNKPVQPILGKPKAKPIVAKPKETNVLPKEIENTQPPSEISLADIVNPNKKRTLRNFETIRKIVNTHPHEYLVDIYELLYMKKPEPRTIRIEILDFTGFTFAIGSAEYVKRKQLLDRMLYNSVRRIFNTLIHDSTAVKVFSKPTMIKEIFNFLLKLPDHDTSVRLPPTPTPPNNLRTFQNLNVSSSSNVGTTGTSVTSQGAINNPATQGKLSDLKRVFQRVACFPWEYLVDVHKLLFMTDCDPKVIRQNIFGFKGFSFSKDSPEFQQRKMYLEYLTFHSLRKISSVLTTRSVDLRNSTKHELASHLTQVLAEYTNTYVETEPIGAIQEKDLYQLPIPDSSNSEVENIVVTPIIGAMHPSPSTSPEPNVQSTNVSKTQINSTSPNVSNTSITVSNTSLKNKNSSKEKNQPPLITVSTLSTKSPNPSISNIQSSNKIPESKQHYSILKTKPNNSTPSPSGVNRKRKMSPPPLMKVPAIPSNHNLPQNVNLPPVEKYNQTYGQMNPSSSLLAPNKVQSCIEYITIDSSQEEPPEKLLKQVSPENEDNEKQSKKSESKSQEEPVSSIHSKIRDVMNEDDEDDCDKPLSALLGHPNDKVLKQQICDIVEKTNLQEITINGVIQKIYALYPEFDLGYRKEYIKNTLRSLLYRLGEQKSLDGKSKS